jgi:nicotinamidase/pyrazinamidase
MTRKNIIFWDIDTQFDFMKSGGKLYMPGAENIIDKISKIRRFALYNGFSIIASTDWHNIQDEEISEEPDYEKSYPQHCIANQKGSERVGYLGNIEIDYIENTKMDEDELRTIADKEQFHIVIRKNQVNVFTNPNTKILLDLIELETIVIYGVALEVCVSITADILLKENIPELIILKDGVKSLGNISDDKIFTEFQQKGVKICEFKNLNSVLGALQQA